MYERQDGVGLEIGSYAHRPILHDPDEIPSIEEAALSPTEFPFTQADFEPQMQHALELMPEIVGDESVGVKYAINGILSLTPDGMPILGETPEVKGLWSAAAVWVKEGPGVGKSLAEWMVHGESEIDLHTSDIARFHDAPEDARARQRAHERGVQQDLRHRPPRPSSGRPTATCGSRPCTPGTRRSARRSSRPPAGSARSGSSPTRRSSRSTACSRARPSGTRAGGRRSSTPSTSRCASARASSTSPPSRSSTSAARARSTSLQRVAMRQVDVADRPRRLHAAALARRRLQVRPHDHAPRPRPLPRRHRRGARHGRPQAVQRQPARRRLGAARRRHDGLDDDRPLGPARPRHPRLGHLRRRLARGLPASAPARSSRSARRSCSPRASPTSATSAGSCTCRSSRARGSGTRSGRPASRTGIVPCGIGVYGTTGRLEKGYRAYGAELETEYDVVEAGMHRPRDQGAGLHRQGGAPAPSARPTRLPSSAP